MPSNPATSLTVWLFDTAAGAGAGEVRVKDLVQRGGLTVHDAITVTWMPEAERPVIGHLHHATATAAVRGSVVGVLAGALFLVPGVGAGVGAGLAALAQRLRGTGIDEEFLAEVGEQLRPGTSALMLLSSAADPELVGPVLEQGLDRGDVRLLRADLAADAPQALRALLDDLDSP
ncbi:DUF1269 domain-containing protein [Nocardioides dubius]|uniref:DUF1269 domain-containing protein n=1 Tax=Nocardioides dubius TaxID=317019 RepID=A0ABP4EJZ8_9ACTN